MPKLKLSSKAKTLIDLSTVLKSAKVLPLYKFNALHYKDNVDEVLQDIQIRFHCDVIVRSSSSNEDNFETSNAGEFESIANVDSSDTKELRIAIDKVLNSYDNNLNSLDEVFIQPMLTDVTMAGVIFSSDIDTLSSYYIINYDENGTTDSVTSGLSNELKSFICFKENNTISNCNLKKIIETTRECEELFNNRFLDIEFAFHEENLYILQVRAIVTNNKENLSNINLTNSLRKLNNKIHKLNTPHPNLLGDKTIFGVMPDWNPAEIIGIRPKRLALTLYKELITDETWAYQRDNYGYRNLRSHPLLVSFLGIPFIDVRISFNSFIPKNLDHEISHKLVNYYLNKLSENINHHDKVEFEIIYSCYYFGIEQKLSALQKFGFNQNELDKITKSLLDLTNNIINTTDGLYKKDLKKVDLLKNKFNNIVNSQLSVIDKIYWLVKDVKRYGTLPFAGIARAGFIAIQILKSLVDENIITLSEYNSFLSTLNTVSKQQVLDIGSLSKKDFLSTYGHLRPGTYDILSPCYAEEYDTYFNNCTNNTHKTEYFHFSSIQKKKIEELILINGLNTNFENLLIFITESIEGREYAKFEFTKHLSQILKYIEELGGRFDFAKEDLAHLDIQEILNLYSTLDNRDVKNIFNENIEKNKQFYQYTKAIKLPSVIVNPEDIYYYHTENTNGNFITLKKIKSVVITEIDILKNTLQGKIICITSADPGYDYLFSKDIGGLITCYGGANSHMAIRCAEMGIPAVIGCGESNFSKYCSAHNIEIDASNKQVKILS